MNKHSIPKIIISHRSSYKLMLQLLTPKRALRPQTTSFKVRVGAQPVESMERLRSILRHTLPSISILGCQSLVLQETAGGWNFISESKSRLTLTTYARPYYNCLETNILKHLVTTTRYLKTFHNLNNMKSLQLIDKIIQMILLNRTIFFHYTCYTARWPHATCTDRSC